jgi:hypothetical protein
MIVAFRARRRPTRPVLHPLGVDDPVQNFATRRSGSKVAAYRRCLAVTVKPFEQRQLHGTVTICPELEIPNQNVTQK